ncbi:hypothetical protein [Streptomyces meridianus]|uniref:Uncharacterized protein n=1 Tax=Streptomyces meridianus TaxID=2938945 RepID=A0ABT0XAZ6_9ACTN|nr:hypothetical protein [Streptomyces meridianus]MCM2579686.1 hypothetical protein [Streptomyces meridianus]
MAGAGAEGLERVGGIGVTLPPAKPVGVIVERPAVEVGVPVGVGIPGVEDLPAVAEEAVEAAEERAVIGGMERDGEAPICGSARGVEWAMDWEHRGYWAPAGARVDSTSVASCPHGLLVATGLGGISDRGHGVASNQMRNT